MKNKFILLLLLLINIIIVEVSSFTTPVLYIVIFHGFLFLLFEASCFAKNFLERHKINTPFLALSINFFRIISSAIFIIYFLNQASVFLNRTQLPYVYNFFALYFIYLFIYTPRKILKS